MLPYQRNKKVDISKLNPQEQQLFAKYGELPMHKTMLKRLRGVGDRKYFDSGDYALSKAGVTPPTTVGTAIPNPENIPHASSGNGLGAGHQSSSISPTNSTNPINRESSLSHSEVRGDEQEAPTPADEASTQPANIQTGFDVDSEALEVVQVR